MDIGKINRRADKYIESYKMLNNIYDENILSVVRKRIQNYLYRCKIHDTKVDDNFIMTISVTKKRPEKDEKQDGV